MLCVSFFCYVSSVRHSLFTLLVMTSLRCTITSLEEERANLSVLRTLFDLCVFSFVGFLLVSRRGSGL